MTRKSLPIRDGEITYVTFGKGRKPVVFLPGVSLKKPLDGADGLERRFSAYTDDYTFYFFERPTALDRPTVTSIAEDTVTALDLLGLQKVYLFGASFGGMLAQTLLVRHPERVHAVVLASTAPSVNPTFDANRRAWLRDVEHRDLDAFVDDFFGVVFSTAFYGRYRDFFKTFIQDATETDYDRFASLCRAMANFNLVGELQSVKTPTLVIGAEGDRTMTADASRELASLTGGKLYIYPTNHGHAVYDEDPDYYDRVFAFFNR